MIVMIFLTQNKFLNGPGISDRLLGFYPLFIPCIPFFHLPVIKWGHFCLAPECGDDNTLNGHNKPVAFR